MSLVLAILLSIPIITLIVYFLAQGLCYYIGGEGDWFLGILFHFGLVPPFIAILILILNNVS